MTRNPPSLSCISPASEAIGIAEQFAIRRMEDLAMLGKITKRDRNGSGTISRLSQQDAVISRERANWLRQQSDRQFREGQLQAALATCQEALAIYREIGDREAESHSLEAIVRAYAYLNGWS